MQSENKLLEKNTAKSSEKSVQDSVKSDPKHDVNTVDRIVTAKTPQVSKVRVPLIQSKPSGMQVKMSASLQKNRYLARPYFTSSDRVEKPPDSSDKQDEVHKRPYNEQNRDNSFKTKTRFGDTGAVGKDQMVSAKDIGDNEKQVLQNYITKSDAMEKEQPVSQTPISLEQSKSRTMQESHKVSSPYSRHTAKSYTMDSVERQPETIAESDAELESQNRRQDYESHLKRFGERAAGDNDHRATEQVVAEDRNFARQFNSREEDTDRHTNIGEDSLQSEGASNVEDIPREVNLRNTGRSSLAQEVRPKKVTFLDMEWSKHYAKPSKQMKEQDIGKCENREEEELVEEKLVAYKKQDMAVPTPMKDKQTKQQKHMDEEQRRYKLGESQDEQLSDDSKGSLSHYSKVDKRFKGETSQTPIQPQDNTVVIEGEDTYTIRKVVNPEHSKQARSRSEQMNRDNLASSHGHTAFSHLEKPDENQSKYVPVSDGRSRYMKSRMEERQMKDGSVYMKGHTNSDSKKEKVNMDDPGADNVVTYAKRQGIRQLVETNGTSVSGGNMYDQTRDFGKVHKDDLADRVLPEAEMDVKGYRQPSVSESQGVQDKKETDSVHPDEMPSSVKERIAMLKELERNRGRDKSYIRKGEQGFNTANGKKHSSREKQYSLQTGEGLRSSNSFPESRMVDSRLNSQDEQTTDIPKPDFKVISKPVTKTTDHIQPNVERLESSHSQNTAKHMMPHMSKDMPALDSHAGVTGPGRYKKYKPKHLQGKSRVNKDSVIEKREGPAHHRAPFVESGAKFGTENYKRNTNNNTASGPALYDTSDDSKSQSVTSSSQGRDSRHRDLDRNKHEVGYKPNLSTVSDAEGISRVGKNAHSQYQAAEQTNEKVTVEQNEKHRSLMADGSAYLARNKDNAKHRPGQGNTSLVKTKAPDTDPNGARTANKSETKTTRDTSSSQQETPLMQMKPTKSMQFF